MKKNYSGKRVPRVQMIDLNRVIDLTISMKLSKREIQRAERFQKSHPQFPLLMRPKDFVRLPFDDLVFILRFFTRYFVRFCDNMTDERYRKKMKEYVVNYTCERSFIIIVKLNKILQNRKLCAENLRNGRNYTTSEKVSALEVIRICMMHAFITIYDHVRDVPKRLYRLRRCVELFQENVVGDIGKYFKKKRRVRRDSVLEATISSNLELHLYHRYSLIKCGVLSFNHEKFTDEQFFKMMLEIGAIFRTVDIRFLNRSYLSEYERLMIVCYFQFKRNLPTDHMTFIFEYFRDNYGLDNMKTIQLFLNRISYDIHFFQRRGKIEYDIIGSGSEKIEEDILLLKDFRNFTKNQKKWYDKLVKRFEKAKKMTKKEREIDISKNDLVEDFKDVYFLGGGLSFEDPMLKPGRGEGMEFLDEPFVLDHPVEPEKPVEIRKCRKCGEAEKELFQCSRCKDELYCSRKCQVDDWHNHKENCKIF